jgi:hypothetical protein
MKQFAKYFVIAEACLLVLPCAIWWGLICGNWSFPIGHIIHKLSYYFMPAVVLAPSEFCPVKGTFMPHGFLGWSIVVGIYSILSFSIALIVARIKNLNIKGTQNMELEHVQTVQTLSEHAQANGRDRQKMKRVSIVFVTITVAILVCLVVVGRIQLHKKRCAGAKHSAAWLIADIEARAERTGALPIADHEGLVGELEPQSPRFSGPVDPWGTLFRYRVENDTPSVESAGPDHEFGTKDDINVKGSPRTNRENGTP